VKGRKGLLLPKKLRCRSYYRGGLGGGENGGGPNKSADTYTKKINLKQGKSQKDWRNNIESLSRRPRGEGLGKDGRKRALPTNPKEGKRRR